MRAGIFLLAMAVVLATAGLRAQQTDPMPPETTAPPPTNVAPAADAPEQPAAEPAAAQNAGDGAAQAGQEAAEPAQPQAGAPRRVRRTYTLPVGTKVLLQLKSAVNTKTAKAGDGVYLVSIFPVVGEGRVLIPSGVYVQGTVDRVERAGRVKGRAELEMHFTSIIFPNGSVVEIPGMVDSLPGSKQAGVKKDDEGTIQQQENDKMRHAGKVAEVAVPTGATIGSIGGLNSDHPVMGGLAGVAGGLATAGLVALFTRGADVNIEAGTQVEMVLQRPLVLEEQNLGGDGAAAGADLQPAPNQAKPLGRRNRLRPVCPVGGLGCS